MSRPHVDTERCILTGTCEAVAPGVFEIDDDGALRVLQPVVPAGLLEAARTAVASCPTRALSLQDA